MVELWFGIVSITVFVVVILLRFLIGKRHQIEAKRINYDIAIFKHQLLELDSDLKHGIIMETEVEAARSEIARRLLRISNDSEDAAALTPLNSHQKLASIFIGLGVPIIASTLYFYLGSPNYSGTPYLDRNIHAERESQKRIEEGQKMAGLIKNLADRMKREPNDVRGWLLLGRTYLTMEREEEAIKALRKAVQISGEDPAVTIELAEALVIAADNKVNAEARKLFRNILSREARDPRARYYLALADAQNGNLRSALQGWVDLLAVSPPGAPWRETVNESIENAAKKLRIEAASVKPSLSAKLLGTRKINILPSQQPTSITRPNRTKIEAAELLTPNKRARMIRSMVDSLADRLRAEPDDLDGWRRLARAYQVLGEFKKAKEATAQIERLTQ